MAHYEYAIRLDPNTNLTFELGINRNGVPFFSETGFMTRMEAERRVQEVLDEAIEKDNSQSKRYANKEKPDGIV